MKEIMLERYDEEKGTVRISLSKAIEEEVKIYRALLKLGLSANKSVEKIEHSRRWKTSKNNDVTIRFIIEGK